MAARKFGDDRRRRLEIAALVAAHVASMDVERQRARELRRGHRPGEVPEEIVGGYGVVLRPLAVADVFLEMIVEIPLGYVAGRIGPDAAVEDEMHGQLLRDGVV